MADLAVMLLDLKLPKVNGFEVLRQIRADENLKMMPDVTLTSSHEECDVVQNYKLGVNAYVVKPMELPTLLANAVKSAGSALRAINEPPPSSIKKAQ